MSASNNISVSNPTQPVISVTDDGGVLITVAYQSGTGGGGSGDVIGPASSTDNAIARYDGTTGKLIQDSGITIADGATGTLAGSNSGDVTLGASVTDVLAVTGQSISGVDQGADRLVFWDESANKLTALTAGSGLSISGTTITATATGDVVGPASSTDNALVRFDSTTGKLIQNGQITESDTGDLAAINSLAFDTTPTGSIAAQGEVMWNSDEETLDIQLNSFAQHVGEHVLYHVKNSTGSTIAKGVPVMFAGTNGASGKLLVQPWNGTGPSTYFMGLTAEELSNAEEGFVISFGKLRGIQTNGGNYGETWADGEIIYVGTTTGSLTKTQPAAPNPHIQVCAVVNAHASNGTLFVRPTLGSNIKDDEGVTITSLSSGQLLIANNAGTVFENKSVSGDATLANTGALTLATVNSNVGSFGSATAAPAVTVNAKGLVTAVTTNTITPAVGSITGLGTGVATALAVNVGTSGAFVANGGALGTPSSGTLTSCTGLPVSTGISGLGTGVATALAVNVGTSGAFVANGGALGTPSSGTLTSCTGLPISTGISGLGTGVATALAVNVGTSGAFVANGGALGTPSSGTLTSCTGLPISTGVSGLGTNVAASLANAMGASGTLAILGANTFTGAQTLSANGAASTPSLSITGSIFTGGSGSTNTPQVLIQPSSGVTANTGWNTSGTALGVVLPVTGTLANFLHFRRDNISYLSINGTGRATGFEVAAVGGAGLQAYTTQGSAHQELVANRTVLLGDTSTGLRMSAAYYIGWSSSAAGSGDAFSNNDLIIRRDAAGILAQRNGTNAQSFRVYNTFTSATNFELASIGWGSNILSIGTEKGSGGGTARAMRLVTDATARAVFEATTFNTTLLASAGSYGSGSGVLFLGNATTAPTTDPTGGGILYVESSSLKFRGESGGNNTLAILGANTFTGIQTLPAGSVAAPSLTLGDSGTGLYRSALNEFAITNNGTQRFRTTTTGAVVTGTLTVGGGVIQDLGSGQLTLSNGHYAAASGFAVFSRLIISSSGNGGGNFSGIRVFANNSLMQESGVSSQTFQVANTYTSTTNFEAGVQRWTANVFEFGTIKGSGGGTARAMSLMTDGTSRVNIGAAGEIGLYGVTAVARATTAGAASTFVTNTSGILNDTATFDGYTIGQVVKALRNVGILT